MTRRRRRGPSLRGDPDDHEAVTALVPRAMGMWQVSRNGTTMMNESRAAGGAKSRCELSVDARGWGS